MSADAGLTQPRLSLVLELSEQSSSGFECRLRVKNQSEMRLFIPTLEITGLKFSPAEDSTPLDWYTNTLVSAESGGTTIDVSDEQIFVFRIRPCAISEDNGHYSKDWDYQRWCLRLVQGEYRVWYDLEVSEDYFNADSHLRFNDIEQMARKANAHLWCGSAKSNTLAVYHVER